MSAPSTVTFRCPQCGAEHQLDGRWAPWCDQCEWGATPDDERERGSRFDRWWRRRLDAASANEHERLLARGLAAGPGRDRTAVLLLATLVHTVTAAVIGLMLCIWLVPTLLAIQVVVTALALGLAFLMNPAVTKDKPGGLVLDRERAPHLWGLVDEVAAALDAAPPARIELRAFVNASWGSVGWRQTRVMSLGYPLWAALEGQEKVALLGHEIGHEVNGDLSRGRYVYTALHELREWAILLTIGTGGLAVLLFPVASALLMLRVRLDQVASRSHQYAEHKADDLGAKLAGTDGAVALEQAMLDPAVLGFAVTSGLRADNRADIWELASRHRREVPEHEKRRQLVMARKTLASVDSTHPPTYRRMELLTSHPGYEPEVVLTTGREAAMDAEIRACEEWVRRRYAGKRQDV